jgi:hypothetical protein
MKILSLENKVLCVQQSVENILELIFMQFSRMWIHDIPRDEKENAGKMGTFGYGEEW